MGRLIEWLQWMWCRRNKAKLRNVAAWAMHHHADGGAHDAKTVLRGHADKRIRQAAYGKLGRIASEAAAELNNKQD